MGAIGAVAINAASAGVASAASTGGRYTCATPLGNEHVQVTITTLNTTTPKTVPKTTDYQAQPQAKATIPSSLIATAHTATPSLTSLSLTKATLSVNKVNFSGTGLFHANNVPHTVPITTTTEAHGAIITITYTPKTFTGTATSGKDTLQPATLLLHVEVTLTCYPPAETITYTKKAAPTTTETTFTHYVVGGSDTLGVITTVNATPHSGPLTLSPTGALPAGQATVHYSQANYWTATGGKGTDVFTETGTLDGLTFSSSGSHASLSGNPTAPGTFPFTVTVKTKTGATAVTHNSVLIAAAPSTPVILQTFKLNITGGSLTLTCGNATHTTPVETQHTAITCTLITLGTYKLAEVNHPITKGMNPLYISTARGGPTDDWTLNAVMVPTTTTLTHNVYCNTVQGFCNVTTTTPAKLATIHTYQNTTILPNYLGLHGYTCLPQRTHLSPYYNVNPTPTTTPGRTPETTAHGYGLSTTMTLCTAAAGVSGGEFIVKTGTYTLIVPPNIYAGTYYGTVQYTLVASV